MAFFAVSSWHCPIDLQTEVKVFLNEKNHRHAIQFQDKKWMRKVCYLSDIITTLNKLNTQHINARQKSKHHHSLQETVCLQRKAATLEE